MDLCTGGELFDRICEVGMFNERDAANIIKTAVDCIRYLHSVGIVHRDIKVFVADIARKHDVQGQKSG